MENENPITCGKCPVMHGGMTSASMAYGLVAQGPELRPVYPPIEQRSKTNPLGAGFDYREEVKNSIVEALKAVLKA